MYRSDIFSKHTKFLNVGGGVFCRYSIWYTIDFHIKPDNINISELNISFLYARSADLITIRVDTVEDGYYCLIRYGYAFQSP
jgi:hypothetical protein